MQWRRPLWGHRRAAGEKKEIPSVKKKLHGQWKKNEKKIPWSVPLHALPN
jgi:hypothetical protein